MTLAELSMATIDACIIVMLPVATSLAVLGCFIKFMEMWRAR